MNSVEIKNVIRDTAAQKFIDANPDALAINGKDYTFVVPVDVEGKTYWAKVGITSCQYADTKARPAFNPDTDATPAMAAFLSMVEKREADKAAAEAKRREKKPKKDEDDDE